MTASSSEQARERQNTVHLRCHHLTPILMPVEARAKPFNSSIALSDCLLSRIRIRLRRPAIKPFKSCSLITFVNGTVHVCLQTHQVNRSIDLPEKLSFDITSRIVPPIENE